MLTQNHARVALTTNCRQCVFPLLPHIEHHAMVTYARELAFPLSIWFCPADGGLSKMTSKNRTTEIVDDSERLLSVKEAACFLGTTERFPRRLISEGRIDYIKVGRHVRIRQSTLHRYINEHTIKRVLLPWEGN